MAARSKSVQLVRCFNRLAHVARRNGCRLYSHRTTEPGLTTEPVSTFVGHNFKYFNEGDGVTASLKADVNGAKLNFEVAGTGNKCVLLCPGALGSARLDFGQQLDNLNKDMFTVIGWDPRGYGFSRDEEREWPVHFIERDAHDAATLMQTLKETKHLSAQQYYLLGWSDGGATAMILAARYPDKVRKLIIWGANAYVTEEDMELYEKLRDISNWSERMRSSMEQMYGLERLQELWNAWLDSMKRYLTERQGDICQEELAKIECPTLIIEGGNDAIVPGFHPEYLRQHIKKSQLVKIPEGKHNLHMQLHHQFNSIVEKFLVE